MRAQTPSEVLYVLQKRYNSIKQDNYRLYASSDEELADFFDPDALAYAKKMLEEDIDSVPNHFQNPITYHVLRLAIKTFKTCLKADSFFFNGRDVDLLDVPTHWGSLDGFDLSASVCAPNGEPLIILNEGAIITVKAVSQIVASILSRDNLLDNEPDPDVLFSHIYSSSCLNDVRAFIEHLLSYQIFGGIIPRKERAVPTSEIEIGILSNLINGSYLYIVAHEYAHYLLGHLDRKRFLNINYEKDKINELSNQKQEELDADCLAVQLLSSSEETFDGFNGFILVMGLFNTFSHLDSRAGRTVSKTHPSGLDRIDYVLAESEVTSPDGISTWLLYICTFLLAGHDHFSDYLSEKHIEISEDNYPRMLSLLYEEYNFGA